jgi:hypothetical protein
MLLVTIGFDDEDHRLTCSTINSQLKSGSTDIEFMMLSNSLKDASQQVRAMQAGDPRITGEAGVDDPVGRQGGRQSTVYERRDRTLTQAYNDVVR